MHGLLTGGDGLNLIILKPALCDSIATEKNDSGRSQWAITECAELEGTTRIIQCYPLDHSPIQPSPWPLPRAWAPLQQLHPQGSVSVPASEPLYCAKSLWVNPNLWRETTQFWLKYATLQQRKQNCHLSKKIHPVTNEQLRMWHLEIPVCGTFFHRLAEP